MLHSQARDGADLRIKMWSRNGETGKLSFFFQRVA
jgi:hypothetical protein